MSPTRAAVPSALLLLVPLALMNRLRRAVASPRRVILLTLASVGAVCVAFSPWNQSPLAFLPAPFLVWAAFTESMYTVHLQAVTASVLASVLTFLGGGPFAHPDGVLTTENLLQLYALSLVAMTLAISALRNERRRSETQQAAFQSLVTEAFSRTKNGFAVLQENLDRSIAVVDINPVAAAVLAGQLAQHHAGAWTVIPHSDLDNTLTRARSGLPVAAEWRAEVDGVQRAFEVTATSSRRAEIGQVFLVDAQDLTDMREQQRELQQRLERERQTAQALRDANQEKDDFVASVTHELRTPLTSILGYAEELDEVLDGAEKEFVVTIRRNANRLLELVNNVLTLSGRAQTHAPSGPRVPCDLGRFILDAVQDSEHERRAKEMGIDIHVDGRVLVSAIPAELTRILSNILSNALKFSPRNGTITIRARREDNHAKLTVEDEGVGISESEIDRLFDPFYRSPSATRAGIAGTGLGLTIVRDLITNLNGTIHLTPREPHGTRVTITLPAHEPVS